MSLTTRRLYLSSLDSNLPFINDGHINIDLTRADIHCKNSQLIAVSLVRMEIPATVAIGTYIDSTDPQNNNLILQITRASTPPVTKDFIFNNRVVGVTNPLQFPLTQQSVITDIIAYINEAFGEESIKIDDSIQTLGIFRLTTPNNAPSLTFNFEFSSPEILRALGAKTVINTSIQGGTDASPDITRTPYNWDLSQVLPVIRIKTNLNFNSNSSDADGDSNILDSVSTATTNGNQYFSTLGIIEGGNTINIKNKSMIIHENSYMAKQIVPSKRIDNLEIRLVTQDDKLITVGQQPFSLVVQIDILEGL
tara:strand:+ start:209 stop:1132 length:924 start_codon:yes stop_codon:yes gene_type:complete